mmetsp:Transcript_15015/g.19474  ORF Transcript_15015/g.19474 Transcript_15015/m.19474 type:complete len:549 (-) Transcript_15015:170-1816(-)
MFECVLTGRTLKIRTKPWNMRVQPLDGEDIPLSWKRMVADLKRRVHELELEKTEWDLHKQAEEEEHQQQQFESENRPEVPALRKELKLSNLLRAAGQSSEANASLLEQLQTEIELNEAKTLEITSLKEQLESSLNELSSFKETRENELENERIAMELKDQQISELTQKIIEKKAVEEQEIKTISDSKAENTKPSVSTKKKASTKKKKKMTKAETEALIKIQAQARRVEALKEIEEKREIEAKQRQDDAAARVQAMVRRNEAIRLREEQQEKEKQRIMDEQKKELALKVQMLAREREAKRKAYNKRKELEAQQKAKENEGATKVQSIARKKIATKVVHKKRLLRFAACARLIQSLIRARKAKHVVHELKVERNHQIKRNEAAARVQGLHRMRRASIAIDARKVEIDLEKQAAKELATAMHYEEMYRHGSKTPSFLRQQNCECCLCRAKEIAKKSRAATVKKSAQFVTKRVTGSMSTNRMSKSANHTTVRFGTKKVELPNKCMNANASNEKTMQWVQTGTFRRSGGAGWTRRESSPIPKRKQLERTISFP